MSLFNKNENNSEDFFKERITPFLQEGEVIENIFPLVISFFCITNKRFIFVGNTINLKEHKQLIYTIPFDNVNEVGLVYDASMKIFKKNEINLMCKGNTHALEFYKNVDIIHIYNRMVSKII